IFALSKWDLEKEILHTYINREGLIKSFDNLFYNLSMRFLTQEFLLYQLH
ncbi:unnamed protein product, partial [marine sediment metagenome]